MRLSRHHLLILLALLALYFIWGSTYLAMRFAIESFPPFLMAAIRFLVAGGLLYLVLWFKGYKAPVGSEWFGAFLVGTLLLAGGNGGVAYAEQTVSSGVAALAVATMPLWAAVFASMWKHPPSRREWLGVMIGTIGVVVLNLGTEMQASPVGAIVLLLAAASWAFGSIWGKHLSMPKGMMASASQMLCGGLVLLFMSLFSGEQWPQQVTQTSFYALIYLVVFGSLVAYSAYLYLFKTVRPALATSYAFVNPVVAMMLGALLANEVIGRAEYVALAIIVLGVLLVLPLGRQR
ncbi:drug/metabolite exporter YedA [Methylobacillus gramineus]|uniref:drug/metabolite exporter YedA n=1 Tax=Methylobacillus gramineus TaxID=755169 RepID=UPI001CFF60FB|nr:drug/metabolite exporter YedA [Methylobacillus gramineus]MCB5185157.1 drug/metabolite exporter YedA [Methylobacillus gramineus]